ncbi:hypothetical protein BDV38DRAFT_142586 [Aspergillus pseudotamarii]|uniref:Uncharacterized protein n=1 Tax=Aspergillus pseudotamarii TaxID=132259 RepID=A0A5N6SN22_ASPPS|nr:uncharacterized protein BDV38DRAFT_142586 [Aspergillus pseudotamarii]KAE8135111.1 hypothetical protein BDV38DRAFT_142586 [Aspergillus pseudotamarii]
MMLALVWSTCSPWFSVKTTEKESATSKDESCQTQVGVNPSWSENIPRNILACWGWFPNVTCVRFKGVRLINYSACCNATTTGPRGRGFAPDRVATLVMKLA